MLFVASIENLKNLKDHKYLKKLFLYTLFAISARMKMKKYLKKN